MINVSNTFIDETSWEDFFTKNLQSSISFTLGPKTIRKGRLIIFKRSHYFIQISLSSSKKSQETFEIPIPFKTEYYPEENLIYFDYRSDRLIENALDDDIVPIFKRQITKNSPSQYFNKILEIQTII